MLLSMVAKEVASEVIVTKTPKTPLLLVLGIVMCCYALGHCERPTVTPLSPPKPLIVPKPLSPPRPVAPEPLIIPEPQPVTPPKPAQWQLDIELAALRTHLGRHLT